jgi:hypothetical protein
MTGAKRVLLGVSLAVIALLATAVGLAPARGRAQLLGWVSIAGERASFPRSSPDSVRRIIAAAEASGLAFPGGEKATSPRRCVEAEGRGVTSGDVSAGSWKFYRTSWLQGGGKLWWYVARPFRGSDSARLIIRAVRLDRPLPAGAERDSRSTRIRLRPVSRRGDTLVFTLTEPKATSSFPSGVRVPTPGRWMFIASMGDNWGCFLYRL